MKITSNRLLRWFVSITLLSLPLASARAAAYNWTNQVPPANGNWSATANWSPNTAPVSDAASTIRFFSGLVSTNAGPGTTTVNSTNDLVTPLLLNSLDLSGSGGGSGSARKYLTINIYGTQLSLTNNGATAPTVVASGSMVANGSNLTYNVYTPMDFNTNVITLTGAGGGNAAFNLRGPLSGSGGLTKSGASTISLTTNSTFTGPVLVNGGGLNVSGSSLTNAGNITVTNDAQLNFNQAPLTFTNNATTTLSGSGAAGATGNLGQGAMTVRGNSAALYQNGNVILMPTNSGGTVRMGIYGTIATNLLNGVISGTASLSLYAQGAGTSHYGKFFLNTNNTYTGTTAFECSAANTIVTLGTDNALPTTTVLTLNQNFAGIYTNYTQLILNGHTQTLGGLVSTLNPAPAATNRITGGSATLSTLVISNAAGTYNFTNLLGGFSANDNNLALVKQGAGTLNLFYANTYTGDTTVSGGTLGISTVQTGGGAFTVSDGATLSVLRDATVTNMAMTTLTLGSSAGASLAFTLPNGLAPTNASVPQVITAGALNLTGVSTVQISGNYFAPGVYRLISYTSKNVGGSIASTPIVPQGMQATIVDTGSSIDLQITGLPASLLWQGYQGGTWDTSTANWTNASTAAAAAFQQNDLVTLDDSALTGNLTLAGTLQPTAVTFSNSSLAYTLSGSGSLAGPGSLTLAGSGTVTLATANSYSGGTTIGAGTLQLGDGAAANGSVAGAIVNKAALVVANPGAQTMANVISGTGSLTKTAAGTLTLSGASTYSGATTISTGTLQLGAAGALPGNSSVTLNGTLDLNGFSQQLNNLSGAGTVDTLAGGTPTLTLTNAAAVTFNGVIQNTAGTLSLVKYGAGTLTLNGVQTYSGPTTLNGAGKLQIDGAGQLGAGNYAGTISNNITLIYNSSAAQTLSGVISGPGALTHSGSGALTLSGDNTYTGATTINGGGTLTLSGNRTTNAGAINVSGGTLNLTGGNLPISNVGFYLGQSLSGTNATVNQSGGSLSFTASNLELLIGNTVGAAGVTNTYNLSGGSVTGVASGARGVMLGVNPGSAANPPTDIFNLSGSGMLNMAGATLQLGRSDATASYHNAQFNQTCGTATFGTLNVGGIATATNINAVLSLTGGSFSATNFGLLSASTNCVSTITLGGTADVTLPAFPTARGAGATASLTFDGGVLRPYAASATYLSGLNQAYLTTNGANFNVAAGNDITVAQVLQDAPSQAGVLTKAGTGTLTLTAASTYSGSTIVSNGTLVLTGSASVASSVIAVASGAVLDVSGVTGGFQLLSGQTLSGAGTLNGAVTVTPGGILKPGLGGADTSALTIANDLTLAGATVLTLNRTNARTASGLSGLNTVTYGGTLTVNNAGPAPVAGDTFPLFSATLYTGNFSATNLPALASGLSWNWEPANGMLSVVGQTLPPTGTNLTVSVSGKQMTFSWPTNYVGWLLQSNSVSVANSNAWYLVPGSDTTNQAVINVDPTKNNVFYRMKHP